jgi:hypothetical protein
MYDLIGTTYNSYVYDPYFFTIKESKMYRLGSFSEIVRITDLHLLRGIALQTNSFTLKNDLSEAGTINAKSRFSAP